MCLEHCGLCCFLAFAFVFFIYMKHLKIDGYLPPSVSRSWPGSCSVIHSKQFFPVSHILIWQYVFSPLRFLSSQRPSFRGQWESFQTHSYCVINLLLIYHWIRYFSVVHGQNIVLHFYIFVKHVSWFGNRNLCFFLFIWYICWSAAVVMVVVARCFLSTLFASECWSTVVSWLHDRMNIVMSLSQ